MNEMSNSENYVELAADVVSAYVSNNSVPAGDLPSLINEIHSTLIRVTAGTVTIAPESLKPAVPAKKSITNEFLVCLEDGRKFKSLKRHLRTQYNMSPDDTARNGALRPTIRWWHRVTQKHARRSPSRWASVSSAARSLNALFDR